MNRNIIKNFLLVVTFLHFQSLILAGEQEATKVFYGGEMPQGYTFVHFENLEIKEAKEQKTYYLMRDDIISIHYFEILDSITATTFCQSDTNVISYINKDKDQVHLVSLYLTPKLRHDTICSFHYEDSLNLLDRTSHLSYFNRDSILLREESISLWNRKAIFMQIFPENKWKEILVINNVASPQVALDFSQILFIESSSDPVDGQTIGDVVIYDFDVDSLFSFEEKIGNNLFAMRKSKHSPLIALKKQDGVFNFWKSFSKDSLYSLTNYEYPLSVHTSFSFYGDSILYWVDDYQKNTRSNGIMLYE